MRTQPRLPRQKVMSFRVRDEFRSLIEKISEKRTLTTGVKWTLTDVIELAVKVLAKKENIR